MPSPKTRIRPLRALVSDDDLHTTRVHGYGFEARCDCGERSPWCASWAMARGWLVEHKRGCKA